MNGSAPPALTAVLRLEDAVFRYGDRPVIDRMTLSVQPGEMVAVVGPNGAGKSTLLRLCSGALKPEHGEVLLSGHPAAAWAPRDRARRVAVVPQFPALDFPFTVSQAVMMGRFAHLDLFGRERAQDWRIVDQVLAETRLSDLAARPVTQLSGGEGQRVALARALVQEAPLLLLDEPTAHLDLSFQVEMLDVVAARNRDAGVTVCAVLHDLNLAAHYFSRMIVIADGRIAADGSPQTVVTRDLLRRIFRVEALVQPHPVTGAPCVVLA